MAVVLELVEAPGGVLGGRPRRLSHHLAGDPRFALDELAGLAESTPPRLLEHHLGDLPLVLPRGDALRLELDAAAVIRQIDGAGSWVVIWHAERFGPYREVLDSCVDQVVRSLTPEEGPTGRRTATLLVASPGAVVPVHYDEYHNVLVQVRGTKEVKVGHFADARRQQLEVEAKLGPDPENAHALPENAETFTLGPGDALYIPPYAFHWVTGGQDVSVALSCAFHTALTQRAARVHKWNRRVRGLGLSPHPPGAHPLVDRAKAGMVTAREALGERVRSRSRRVGARG
jgi:quercetin dioxygenase-like cupin family protein